MPCDYSKYPKNWKSISARIRKLADNKCEDCGVKNGSVGARDIEGKWHDENDIHSMNSGYGEMLFGDFPKMIKIVLTVAHLDHNPQNNVRENLRVWCQRCHLRYDRLHHVCNARKTYETKRGILNLPFKESL